YQIPYKIYGGISFFSRKEIKDIIAYLRVLVNPKDDFSFKRIVNVPKRLIGASIISKLSEIALEKEISLYEAIPYYTGKGKGASELLNFKLNMDSIRALIENGTLRDLVDMILNNMNYDQELRSDMDTYDDRLANIKEFKSVLKETEETYDGDTNVGKLNRLLLDLALRSDNEETNESDAVILSTYHQVKGLEFKTVFLVAMEEEIFPSANSVSNTEIEEERRIFYVGLTRAKNHLFITNAENRFLFGYQRGMIVSRFINEMDKDLYKNVSKGISNLKKTKPTFTYKKPEVKEEPKQTTSFQTGDKINHKAFGDGIVVSVNGSTIVVAFKAPTGVKTLNGNHPSIRKL
ncbi:MAG: ATP-binding domain-containing protein, partial [Acholeplasmatales bacterium]|nr:ATP-binding domain-containing protein [Acholeplasmatales bacterium]